MGLNGNGCIPKKMLILKYKKNKKFYFSNGSKYNHLINTF